MAQQENVIVSVATEFDGKALAKGQKKLTEFEKTTIKAGKILAGVFAAQKLAAFGKNAVHAFLESEKAGKALNQTLTNLGMAYKAPAIDDYLNKLSLQVGIVDEQLKPAYNQLLLATRNTAEAQSILNTALDVSAGTGYDLASVTKALSKAYLGNNTALQKLGIGLSKAQLAGSNFKQLQTQLNDIFAGQAAAAAKGYTGDIAKLSVAFDQFKQSIGKGILEGLDTTNIDQLTESIVKLGDALGKTIGGITKFISVTTEGLSHPTLFLPKKPKGVADAGSDRGGKAKADDQRAATLAKIQAKTAALQTTAAKAQTTAAKAQLLLTKSGSVLDVQQAQIYAALQNKITDQEKLRLDLQLALLTNNSDAAYKLSQELLVSQLQTTDLATTLNNLPKALNPFADWPKYIQDLINQMAVLKGAIPTAPTTTQSTPGNTSNYNSLFDLADQQKIAEAQRNRLNQDMLDPESGTQGNFLPYNNTTYNINVDATNMVDPNNLTTVVQNAILLINRNGLSTVPAGQGF